MSVQREAERQAVLLAGLFAAAPPAALPGWAERGERLARGLGAYRANGSAIAERALAAACPTLAALMGEDEVAALARALWRTDPPRRGDLAQWGESLPAFIAAQRDLDPWPYLADCARLDFAIRRSEAAADADTDRTSLGRLAELPPESLRLRLRPDVELLASRWPIASLHAAQQPGAAPDALERADAAVTLRLGESVVVARAGWRAAVTAVAPPVFAWMQALAAGRTLADALAAAGADFDLPGWLLQALQHGWLGKAEPINDPLGGEPS